MAAYADFNFYVTKYYGDLLNDTNAEKWLSRASDELDALTFGRLIFSFPVCEAHAEKVKKSACAIADALYQIDFQQKAVALKQEQDGSFRGAVASVSSGRESVSYSVNNSSASVYAAAAANAAEKKKLICDIAAKYLAGVPDSNGINLLFAGEVSYVPRHNHTV